MHVQLQAAVAPRVLLAPMGWRGGALAGTLGREQTFTNEEKSTKRERKRTMENKTAKEGGQMRSDYYLHLLGDGFVEVGKMNGRYSRWAAHDRREMHAHNQRFESENERDA